jgi:hypothetical protein
LGIIWLAVMVYLGYFAVVDENNIQGYDTVFHPKAIEFIAHTEQHSVVGRIKFFFHHPFFPLFGIFCYLYGEPVFID